MKKAMIHAIFHSMLLLLSLSLLYWQIFQFSQNEIAESVVQELHDLEKLGNEHGLSLLKNVVTSWSDNKISNERYFLMIDSEGHKVAGNLEKWPENMIVDEQVHQITVTKDLFSSNEHHHHGKHWPMSAIEFYDGSRLLIAESDEAATKMSDFGAIVMTIILLMSISFSLALGFIQGKSATDRMQAMLKNIHAIMQGRYSERLPVSKKQDEFDVLSEHINQMLKHIESLIASLHQVTDNIAHDLRKPLSRLKSRMEVTLLQKRAPEDYEAVFEENICDANQLLDTFSALLDIAQMEADAYRGDLEFFELSDIIQTLVTLYEDPFEMSHIQLLAAVEPDIHVQGHKHLINVMVTNLLENALKYSPSGSTVNVSLKKTAVTVQLTITDEGLGIPVESRKEVLKRFVRLESARSTKGNGLGLSVVNAALKLHHGSISFADNNPGLIVLITLPR